MRRVNLNVKGYVENLSPLNPILLFSHVVPSGHDSLVCVSIIVYEEVRQSMSARYTKKWRFLSFWLLVSSHCLKNLIFRFLFYSDF